VSVSRAMFVLMTLNFDPTVSPKVDSTLDDLNTKLLLTVIILFSLAPSDRQSRDSTWATLQHYHQHHLQSEEICQLHFQDPHSMRLRPISSTNSSSSFLSIQSTLFLPQITVGIDSFEITSPKPA
jgi:glycine cleavage system regulatory protein